MDKYDAVVIGSGPNGLSAAIAIQREGLSVLVIEEKETVGGGARSAELTLPGFSHDVCSSVFPLAVNSIFFESLPLDRFGLEFIYPPCFAAHPFPDGTTVLLYKSIEETAEQLGLDYNAYKNIFHPLLEHWEAIKDAFIAPFHIPKNISKVMRFARLGLTSALTFARNKFKSDKTKAVWSGMAAHSMLPLDKHITSAVAMIMLLMGHSRGWPIAKGGAQSITNALANYFTSLGGTIRLGCRIGSLDQVPAAKAILFDVTPKQLLSIAQQRFSKLYRWQLQQYHYGPGVFKIDWALSEPIPFKDKNCRKAATVHLADSMEEIKESEDLVWRGDHSKHPFIILTQPSLFDKRAPGDNHTAWAYCHVPNGSLKSMEETIEKKVSLFAPGFRDCILARHVMNTETLESYNANYIGGDINGGVLDITQLFTRPALRLSPYKTSAKGIYICSSSTPPGGGVHGLCGYYAAKKALREIFKIDKKWDF